MYDDTIKGLQFGEMYSSSSSSSWVGDEKHLLDVCYL